ncbi:MAG: hypothetical protein ACD_79C00973G0003 [uncultured bacterium]|nr:MAG: hypothetical protein ACD_79C00973G0003 [uncultured bacterium]
MLYVYGMPNFKGAINENKTNKIKLIEENIFSKFNVLLF